MRGSKSRVAFKIEEEINILFWAAGLRFGCQHKLPQRTTTNLYE